MWTLIRDGGVFPMSFLLLFGVTALLAAFFFAIRAERRLLGFIRAMSTATLFVTLGASCADVGATLHHSSEAFDEANAEKRLQAEHMIIEGLGESTSPGIVGFSLVALTSMLVAVGRRRLDEREEVR